MLAYDDALSTQDLLRMLNVPLDAIPSVVREAGRLLAVRADDVSAAARET
ncbi:hypothetical protein [Jiangella rhizosphaerae]|nr:hypothetical protein [Jiangella rhizosphaerae]